MDFAIPHYTNPASVTPMQYADDLYVNSCKVAAAYGESAFINIFVARVDSTICHSIPSFCAPHPHANVTDIHFKEQLLLAIQNGFVKPAPFVITQYSQNPWLNATVMSRKQTLLNQKILISSNT